uniref:Uncharacterized protein n=1 Tax=Arundo donax TaxID=35708 RepID=A0A0A9AV01_ARUDO
MASLDNRYAGIIFSCSWYFVCFLLHPA